MWLHTLVLRKTHLLRVTLSMKLGDSDSRGRQDQGYWASSRLIFPTHSGPVQYIINGIDCSIIGQSWEFRKNQELDQYTSQQPENSLFITLEVAFPKENWVWRRQPHISVNQMLHKPAAAFASNSVLPLKGSRGNTSVSQTVESITNILLMCIFCHRSPLSDPCDDKFLNPWKKYHSSEN